ncbi:hypothetical protein NM208_g7136 [Fusarium decemcellulare]|uniref:Uncharacterized protein n=1 Tax=Fusarium decemcellulare TaxID=57161 RepID=A0ACC1SAG9_9HYPO|nr:hypothetical protein NM208_g7136 [Fusarium decemcellulare]
MDSQQNTSSSYSFIVPLRSEDTTSSMKCHRSSPPPPSDTPVAAQRTSEPRPAAYDNGSKLTRDFELSGIGSQFDGIDTGYSKL